MLCSAFSAKTKQSSGRTKNSHSCQLWKFMTSSSTNAPTKSRFSSIRENIPLKKFKPFPFSVYRNRLLEGISSLSCFPLTPKALQKASSLRDTSSAFWWTQRIKLEKFTNFPLWDGSLLNLFHKPKPHWRTWFRKCRALGSKWARSHHW